jgi:hypothetical protein
MAREVEGATVSLEGARGKSSISSRPACYEPIARDQVVLPCSVTEQHGTEKST